MNRGIYVFKQILPKNGLVQRKFSITGNKFQGLNTHKPNNLEKRFLVWTGKFKNIDEVPNSVSPETMERCRNRIRIRVANLMILGTIVGCILMVISGKKALERGETVSKQNQDWHKKYNEMNPNTDVK